MSEIERYIEAATRANTRRSYQSAIRHFEEEWGGLLPATADGIARYLADYAGRLALNTLRLRLAALSQWHRDQGFPDPTKAPVVRKVLRGIGELHPAREQQAAPLGIGHLVRLDSMLAERLATEAETDAERARQRRAARDRALLLLGFWRAFRGDELGRLRVEWLEVRVGEGMRIHLPRTKTTQARDYRVPALSRLCPVAATQDWLRLGGLTQGPLLRRIDRWGHVGEAALHPNSLIPLLRGLLREAGIAEVERYSAHSLRRGFATWASASDWDIKTLMDYVGWKDLKSAMRYIEESDPFARQRFERALPPPSSAAPGDPA